ncbi:hypothetical protein [Legionella septentrionalis]|uniref:hypothetical protein n=1 Tax=Legionella septentrionalis TaxID=2498109 RepID=UPI000F8DC2D8|nr:hypothetical protein [Legionella septentrionalis]RUR10934.1 hypothetical protein ELY14_03785 [Legionella septentrionalis]
MLTTISLLLLLTGFVLWMLQEIQLYAKTSASRIKSHHDLYALEAAARNLGLSSKAINDSCMVQGDDVRALALLLENNHGCIYKLAGHSYVYALVDLGSYPCLSIQQNSSEFSSHHWLISVKDEQNTILQLRIAKPIHQLACIADKRIIHSGVISWRKLTLTELKKGIF